MSREVDGASGNAPAGTGGAGDTLTAGLHRQLKTAILAGRLIGGTRLPSTRQLSRQSGVSRNTALAVYDLLLSEGLVTSRRGAGTFVRDIAPRKAPPALDARALAERIRPHWRQGATGPAPAATACDFRIGIPDTTRFPFEIWRRAIARAARDLARRRDVHGAPDGLSALRKAIARHVSFTRAVACDAGDIVVTAGAQQALDLIARVLVTPGRTIAAMENPGYPPAFRVLTAAGAKIRPVGIDDEGLVVDELPPRATLIYTTPSHQFPLGATLSARRRNQLIGFARSSGAVIIEDDYDGEFRHHGRPLDALQTLDRSGQVIYVGTFSKSMFPALRLGFIVAPPWLRSALLAAKQLADWQCPHLEQAALAHFIDGGDLARHVRRMRRIYAERHDQLERAIKLNLGETLELVPSSAGLHLAALARRSKGLADLAQRARRAGITVQGTGAYHCGGASRDGLVFGVGLIEAGEIDPAIRRLAALLSR